MREIKFRAWDIDLEKMGEVYWFDKYKIRYILDKDTEDDAMYESLLNQVKLMQYTGLKDKNGVEIYEGDIVSAWHSENNNELYIVEFGSGKFEIEDIRNNDDFGENGENYNLYHRDCVSEPRWIEVIGNIYEDEEMLKGEDSVN